MSKKGYLMIGKVKPNTFIGGVGGTITTKELLADKLSITANEIQSFEIDAQNNVSCYIGVNYSISFQAFYLDSTLTSYVDEDSFCTGLSSESLRSAINLKEISLNGLTSLGQSALDNCFSILFIKLENVTITGGQAQFGAMSSCIYFELPKLTNCVRRTFDGATSAEYIYIPRCTTLGDVNVNDLIFNNIPLDCIVYLDPINWTSNGGSPNLDLQYLIDRGNDVRAVTNFDLPTIPINITKVNDYGAIVDISWVQPIGSTNVIDYYQIYVNGEYNGRTVSNETTFRIENLEQYSFYTVQVVACDYFYNRSYSEMFNIETSLNTAVEQITDLAIHTRYYDGVIVDFTTPTSIYAIDYYEVYLDNVFYNNQKNNIVGIDNLDYNRIYSIKVVAVDVNSNKSEYSNALNVFVDGVGLFIPIHDIISEYKFENNVLDTVGSNDGVATNISYRTGTVGQEAFFDKSLPSYVTIAEADDLSFSDGVVDTAFSYSTLKNFDNNTDTQVFCIKSTPASLDREYDIRYVSGVLRVFLYSDLSVSNKMYTEIPFTPDIGVTYSIIVTYDGAGDLNIYIDGVAGVKTTLDTNYIAMGNGGGNVYLGTFRSVPSLGFSGGSDCTRFWNTDLTPQQALELATQELAGIDITP